MNCLTSENIDLLSEEIQQRMLQLGFSSEKIQRYRLAVEDVLISMKSRLPDDTTFVLDRKECRQSFRILMKFKGEKYNPLRKNPDEPFSDFTDMILSEVGEEMNYSYRRGENIIELSLGKKNHDYWLFKKNFFTIGVPIALQNLLSTVVSCSDMIMLGFISQMALSSVALASQINLVFTNILFSICTATIVMAARHWGKRNREGAKKVLNVSMLYAFSISALFFLLSFLMPNRLMSIFTNDPELVAMGSDYLSIVSWSFILQGFSEVYLSFLRVTGCEVRKTTIVSLTAPVLNIVLNALLIFGLAGLPQMGVKGAAIATVLSRLVQLIFTLSLSRDSRNISISLRGVFRIDKPTFKSFNNLALLDSTRKMLWILSVAAGTAIIAHLGNDMIAAQAIVTLVMNLSFAFVDGLGSACGIFVSNELGRGNSGKALLQAKRALQINVIIGAITGLILFGCIPLIMKVYGDYPPSVLELLMEFLIIACFLPMIKAIGSTTAMGIFTPGGDVVFAFKLDTIVYWGIVIPLGLLSAFVIKPPVWITFAIIQGGGLFRAPIAIHRLNSGKWINKK